MGVLIETLWNVNIFPASAEISASFGINRNIVECKSRHMYVLPRGCAVLIETLWNVNTKR